MSFGYCIATLLEFAGVHYFTKVGSGEFPLEEDFPMEDEGTESEWEDVGREGAPAGGDSDEDAGGFRSETAAERKQQQQHRAAEGCSRGLVATGTAAETATSTATRRRGSSLFCALYNDQVHSLPDPRHSMNITVSSKPSTMERQTQTELWLPKWRQFVYCLIGDLKFRKRRQREAADGCRKHGERIERYINSVSHIDRAARIVFPASFTLLIICYWMVYVTYQEEFKWQDPPMGSASHR